MRRAVRTARSLNLGVEPVCLKILDEIDVGICDGMTYTEINEKLPEEGTERKRDKLNYRYPNGESYMDLINRIEPLIFEIEKTKKNICHQAIIRCIYAYLTSHEIPDVPHLDVPLHTVIKLVPAAYFSEEIR